MKKRQFTKTISLFATAIGFALIFFSSLSFFVEGVPAVVISAGGGVLVAIGTYFFSFMTEADKQKESLEKAKQEFQLELENWESNIKQLQKKHELEIDDLHQELEEKGQNLLIRQYAEDTVLISLISRTLKNIHNYANAVNPNLEAIQEALHAIRHIQFFSFFNKAGKLVQDKSEQILLRKFLSYIENIAKTHKNLPQDLNEIIEKIKYSVQLNNHGQS